MGNTTKRLKMLLVEDSADDEALLVRELNQFGFDLTHVRVEDATALTHELQTRSWDLVVSDYRLPQFDATRALATVRSIGGDLPFIIVSGTLGEEAAVFAMQAGAHDFLLKSNLTRLGPAIERAVRDAAERRACRSAESRVREREAQAREELERRVRERTVELARTNEELVAARNVAESSSRAKSRFLANMSHELRTPLNAIIGLAELLEQEIPGSLLPKQKEYVEQVVNSGRHLLTLVNEILDLSKVEAGYLRLTRTWVHPDSLFESVLGSVRSLANARGLQVIVEHSADLPRLHVDPARMRQVLFNLLSNAIKFTDSGGTVWMRARVEDTDLIIEVQDTGVGIAEQDLSKLFREFEQIEPQRGHKPEGTGLGLALSQRLVEAHGGEIGVRSVAGTGSTFWVRVPCADPTSGTSLRPAMPGEGDGQGTVITGLRVLLVEDNSQNMMLARDLLTHRGHVVLPACDVREALVHLMEATPHIALVDIQIPGGGGHAVLEAIRKSSRLHAMPVIAVTALAMDGDRERLIEAGFDGYVSKPIDTRSFGTTIEAFLHSNRG